MEYYGLFLKPYAGLTMGSDPPQFMDVLKVRPDRKLFMQ